jgi:hypothetical protein
VQRDDVSDERVVVVVVELRLVVARLGEASAAMCKQGGVGERSELEPAQEHLSCPLESHEPERVLGVEYASDVRCLIRLDGWAHGRGRVARERVS